jgi:nucleotide-binding universal stress UspA family protein
MEEKLVTIVILPYAQAHILKMELEAQNIECELEELDLAEWTTSLSVKVLVLEKDVQKALPVLDERLGKKPIKTETKPEPGKEEQHILVPVDFSHDSEMACKMAYNIASHLDVKMVFLHCYINPLVHSIPFSDVYAYDPTLLVKMEYAEKDANEKFQKFITKMADTVGRKKWGKVPSEFIIKAGYADEDILAYAHKNNSRLIVMGRGGSAEYGETLGSVAVDIIYNAQVPVLVVPEDSAEKELNKFSKVLYATNFDEKDFIVIDKLLALLKPFNTKLICAHVGKSEGNGWDQAKLEGMKDILTGKYKSSEFECRLVVGDNILESLQNIIDEEKVDILSLTTHKRNMISRLFNPGLARKMVFHTKTPLLVFHA